MSPVKQEVESVLSRLPDDCSLEDVQYQLFVLQKVRRGLEQIDGGESVSHEEVAKRLDKWLTR